MNTASQPDHPPAAYPARPSGFVTVVAMVLYTGFAIPVSIIAMENMVVVGVLLAAFLAWLTLDEVMPPAAWAGMAVAIVGVLIATRAR